MTRLEGDGGIEIGRPLGESFVGSGEDQIEGDGEAGVVSERDRVFDVGGLVIAFQELQLFGAERLAAKAEPRDAEIGERFDQRLVDVGWIGSIRNLFF